LASSSIESLDASAIESTNYEIANICLFPKVEEYFPSKLEENTEILKAHITDHPYLCEKHFDIFHPANKHRFLLASINHFSSGKSSVMFGLY